MAESVLAENEQRFPLLRGDGGDVLFCLRPRGLLKASGEGEGALRVWIVLGSGGNVVSLSGAEPSSARLLLLWLRPPLRASCVSSCGVSGGVKTTYYSRFLEEFTDFFFF